MGEIKEMLGKKSVAFALAFLATCVALTGCGGNKQGGASQKVAVKAMKVQEQSVPVVYGFPGQLQSVNEVQIRPKISGTVTEKYIKGGQMVNAGDLLFKIDSAQYEMNVDSAEADVRKAESNLRRSREDLRRNEQLYAVSAISEQVIVNSRADVESYAANLDSARAALRKAKENLGYASVYAPLSGRVSLNDVATGTYANAGNTTLVTIGEIDPIYVVYSISETEYLNIMAKFMANKDNRSKNAARYTMTIILSNGAEYPYKGEPVEIDRSLSGNSGSVNVKALFPNPEGLLLPGMFAQLRIVKETSQNTILVPKRAVQQLLDRSLVLVVDENGKSLAKDVKLGEKVGSYYIVEEGLSLDDTVIVEGLSNLQSGKELDVTMVTPEEMGFSVKASTDIVKEN